ncbi:hypothetical protein T03_2301 [Trichinella britovi]|uniref:Uncharacterized protein n=1 Tax=Trichinella britovi TaxID=45882 RepID=A0A0V1D6S3_TRIBR|nr:hypothetical protein T03_2301 [Trichinella britovi]
MLVFNFVYDFLIFNDVRLYVIKNDIISTNYSSNKFPIICSQLNKWKKCNRTQQSGKIADDSGFSSIQVCIFQTHLLETEHESSKKHLNFSSACFAF